MTTRRDMLAALGTTGVAALGAGMLAPQRAAAETESDDVKVYRIGVLSARIEGAPQKTNGHTWHFAQYLHPRIDLSAIAKHHGQNYVKYYELMRDPKNNFGVLPFPDTRISHYYEKDPQVAALFAEAFPGVQVAASPEELAAEVDAIWLGDASGKGDDHFELIAPGLERGLPTFCDKPIGSTVAGTRKILNYAREHKAPLMSSSLFRHEWGPKKRCA